MIAATGPVIAIHMRPASPRDFSAVLSFQGKHDLGTAPDVLRTLSPIKGNVLVDLTRCASIDSTVVGVLIGKSKDLERAGHFLEIVAPPRTRPSRERSRPSGSAT